MTAVIAIGVLVLILWGYWRFYTAGRYLATRPPPDLTGFREQSPDEPDSATEGWPAREDI